MEKTIHSFNSYQWNVFLFSSFLNQVQREDRQENRINGGKESRETSLAQDMKGKTNRTSRERKAPRPKDLRVRINAGMCGADPKTKQKPSNCLIPRTDNFLPSSWFGRAVAYSLQFQWEALSILCKEQIVTFHLQHTRCTDLMSSVKLRHYHRLLVKGFHDVWAWGHSVDFVLGVCVHSVSLYWTTDRQGLCHHWLLPPSGSTIITSTNTGLVSDSRLVPAWFPRSLCFSVLLDVSLHILLNRFSPSSALTLLSQILFSMHFVWSSFNRWHRVAIWDAGKQQAWTCPWGVWGEGDWGWLEDGGGGVPTSSTVPPWTSWIIPSQWEMHI